MFVYNIKINGNRTFKCFFAGIIVLLFTIAGIVCFKIFSGANNASENSGCIPRNKVFEISSSNYTNILKAVHENIDNYKGIKINYTGYVYRVFDLKDNQFILARDMVISSDFQSVIVGFLCEIDDAKNFENNTWVNITGEIIKGDYHGDMPIVKITEIKKVDKPNNEFVYPPSNSYIPTSGLP